MKTEILKQKGNWNEVMNDCRNTVSKEALEKEPSVDFKKRLLISEHSPIRSISFKWAWQSIPSWIATHFSRHKWECFISTQRTDRTGVDRNKLTQDQLVNFIGEANIQQLIDTMRKRLCFCSADETRQQAEYLKESIEGIDSLIARVLVPNCIYRCGCPEGRCNCLFSRFMDYCNKTKDINNMSLQERYDLYDEFIKQEKNV